MTGSYIKRPLIFGVFAFVFSLVIFRTLFGQVSAQTLPASADMDLAVPSMVYPGQEFNLNIGLSSPEQEVVGVDVIIGFDSDLFEVIDARIGNTNLKTLLPEVNNSFDKTKAVKINPTDPKLSTVEIGLAAFDQANQQLTPKLIGSYPAESDAVVGIIFKAKKVGSSTFQVQYEGAGVTTDSNVISVVGTTAAEDILKQPQTGSTISVSTKAYPCLSIDLISDNSIDVRDIMEVANRWGLVSTSPDFITTYDFDLNNRIDIRDIQTIANRWGEICN